MDGSTDREAHTMNKGEREAARVLIQNLGLKDELEEFGRAYDAGEVPAEELIPDDVVHQRLAEVLAAGVAEAEPEASAGDVAPAGDFLDEMVAGRAPGLEDRVDAIAGDRKRARDRAMLGGGSSLP
jgi:hypothetical protein